MSRLTHKEKLAVWIPILISIASLTFGAFQYFDKRSQEQTLLDLQVKKQELELKIAEAERRKMQADISVDYVVTDFQSIKEWTDHQNTFDEAMLKWLRFLENALPYATSLHHRENTIYTEIKSYNEDTTNHYLTFLLLRNVGRSNATDIRVGFDAIDNRGDMEREHSLVLDRLEPGHGVIVPIEHYDIQTNEHFGTWLTPADRLTYFDTYLEEKKDMKVREKYDSAAILGPTLRLGG
ncbi:MAG: hypothetical protein JSW58_11780 [Candidatus Latescibacterota bacterium]|nr:MAG: hypothetical protein JSW58_11780 [Candidatus Latescibacterota bacterium]